MMTDATAPPPRWAGYFFPVGSTVRPAVLRIVCVALQLTAFGYPLSAHLKLLASPRFEDPQLIVRLLLHMFEQDTLRHAAVLGTAWWITTACGILALVGLGTRAALGLFAVGTMLLISHRYSYGEYHHPEALFIVFLFLLAFCPCGDCLSLDAWIRRRGGRGEGRPWYRGTAGRLAMWPLVTVQCLLAVAYADAAMSKLIVGGPSWFNGYTLQNYLLFDGIRNDTWGVHIAPYRWVCVLMAVGAVAFESSFWLLLIPRVRRLPGVLPLMLLAGVGLHGGIYVLQQAPFFQFMVLYLTWVPWERWFGATRGAPPV